LSTLVLDASVAAKWMLPAEQALQEEAASLLRDYARGTIQFIVPDIFWPEIANVAWKSVRQGRWTAGSAENAIREMTKRQFPTVSSLQILPQALEIAVHFDRSVYDALYVALAVSRKLVFITADERLVNALATFFPVRWLGTV
jgi:predicted nucleic acid-binding protein